MRIRFLGTGSGQPNPKRNSSSCLFEGSSGGLLVDAGEGVASRLLDNELWSQEISSIVISHAHADHHCGLIMLIQGYRISGRKQPLEVICSSELEEHLRNWLDFLHLGQEYLSFDLIFRDLKKKYFDLLSGHKLVTWENDHFQNRGTDRGPSSSLRIEQNESTWIYSGDINSIGPLEGKLSGANGLISECTHVDVNDIFELVVKEDLNHLVFTHIPPGFQTYDLAKTTWAYDNLIIQG